MERPITKKQKELAKKLASTPLNGVAFPHRYYVLGQEVSKADLSPLDKYGCRDVIALYSPDGSPIEGDVTKVRARPAEGDLFFIYGKLVREEPFKFPVYTNIDSLDDIDFWGRIPFYECLVGSPCWEADYGTAMKDPLRFANAKAKFRAAMIEDLCGPSTDIMQSDRKIATKKKFKLASISDISDAQIDQLIEESLNFKPGFIQWHPILAVFFENLHFEKELAVIYAAADKLHKEKCRKPEGTDGWR